MRLNDAVFYDLDRIVRGEINVTSIPRNARILVPHEF